MKKLFFTLFLGLLIASCGPQKRFTKLIEKHPWLLTADTLIVRDTIRDTIPKIEVDTVFNFSEIHDTIVIEKDRYRTKIWTVHDSIYVEGECDSVIVEKVIERKIPVKYYEKNRFNWWWLLIPFIILVVYLIYKRNAKV